MSASPGLLVLKGESIVMTLGRNALIVKADGCFRLREWDSVNGWTDRTYRTLAEALTFYR